MNTKKTATWNDYLEIFDMLTQIAFTSYDAPAFPGGDAGCFPTAHPRPTLDTEYDEPYPDEQPEPEWNEPGYIGDGFTNEYDYDHPVHGNALQSELDSEYDAWLDSLSSEPETCDCGRALREHGEPHPDCECCASCGTHPCICPTPEPEDEPEDDDRTQWVDNHEDDWKL